MLGLEIINRIPKDIFDFFKKFIFFTFLFVSKQDPSDSLLLAFPKNNPFPHKFLKNLSGAKAQSS